MPGWLLTVLFAIGFGAIGFGAYVGYRHFSGSEPATEGTGFEEPGTAAIPEQTPSILGKYIEVAGLRLTEDPNKKPQIRFLVVNHSGAEIASLSGDVTLRPTTGKPEDPPIGTFSFTIPSLAPYEAKDMRETVETKLRAYELPDWQFLRADVKLTSP